ncbi:MAG: substrate-binding domain-containing protein [Candidatus Methylacidiphilales bacterium]|nr:substrate-binding domain-containing protein [Candidatus Methylacidiphilales bacterium]
MKIKQLKHKQIETELRQLASTLPPEAKLPAERDLALEYGCNFLTVRKALKQLVDEGLIVRRIGSGTFVSRKNTVTPAGKREPKNSRVGILVYQHGSPYAFAVIQAIAHVALEDNVELRSCWVGDFGEEGLRQAQMLADEGCTALTIPWFPLDRTDEIQSFVRQSPLPISLPVLIPGLERYCFEEKHLFGATMLSATEGLCRYFAHMGHRRIAFLGPDAPSDQVLQQKLGAYSCCMSREGLPMLCGLVDPGSQSMDQLAESWKAFRGDLAIVSYDDEHALRLLTAMHKIGMCAPMDFAIVGYNNADASHYSDPPLSTVRQNYDYLGHWLLKSALALAKGTVGQSGEAPSLDLIVRSSCGGSQGIDEGLRATLRDLKVNVCFEDNAHTPGLNGNGTVNGNGNAANGKSHGVNGNGVNSHGRDSHIETVAA